MIFLFVFDVLLGKFFVFVGFENVKCKVLVGFLWWGKFFEGRCCVIFIMLFRSGGDVRVFIFVLVLGYIDVYFMFIYCVFVVLGFIY